MAIPDFQSLMLPIMRIAADGAEHTARELRQRIGEQLGLTEEERKELLPSGSQPVFTNRLAWARSHLTMAGLLEKTGKGRFRITKRGKEAMASNPASINLRFLFQFPEYAEARNRAKTDPLVEISVDVPASETTSPQERIDLAFRELNNSLITDLRGKLATIDPFRFEQLVLDLLVKMGYGGSKKEAAQVTQRTGDQGIDGVINEDRLGLDVIYVQAKRWKHNVGRPEIQNFVGALAGKKANKGIFITTSSFHDNATDYAAGLHNKVILVDGRRLAELMIEHGIGVAEEHAYSIRKIDSDYFDEA
jgi:restriction system protein